jgi:hypothetical protein
MFPFDPGHLQALRLISLVHRFQFRAEFGEALGGGGLADDQGKNEQGAGYDSFHQVKCGEKGGAETAPPHRK